MSKVYLKDKYDNIVNPVSDADYIAFTRNSSCSQEGSTSYTIDSILNTLNTDDSNSWAHTVTANASNGATAYNMLNSYYDRIINATNTTLNMLNTNTSASSWYNDVNNELDTHEDRILKLEDSGSGVSQSYVDNQLNSNYSGSYAYYAQQKWQQYATNRAYASDFAYNLFNSNAGIAQVDKCPTITGGVGITISSESVNPVNDQDHTQHAEFNISYAATNSTCADYVTCLTFTNDEKTLNFLPKEPDMSSSDWADKDWILGLHQGSGGLHNYLCWKEPVIPAHPMVDGTYVLQCTVSNYNATYSWVKKA